MTKLREELFSLRDESYGEFSAKLVPNIDKELVIGIRTPVLRDFAKRFAKTNEAKEFLSDLPHKYFEENNLHAFLIEQIKDFDAVVFELSRFLPYVNNWTTCDQMSPKALKKNPEKLEKICFEWLNSKSTYTVRFAIKTLMQYFLDDRFDEKYLKAVSEIKSDEYYINMMIAWYFATALAKQKDKVLPYFEAKILPAWIHNKAISKSVESFRIDNETKAYLKTLKIK